MCSIGMLAGQDQDQDQEQGESEEPNERPLLQKPFYISKRALTCPSPCPPSPDYSLLLKGTPPHLQTHCLLIFCCLRRRSLS